MIARLHELKKEYKAVTGTNIRKSGGKKDNMSVGGQHGNNQCIKKKGIIHVVNIIVTHC